MNKVLTKMSFVISLEIPVMTSGFLFPSSLAGKLLHSYPPINMDRICSLPYYNMTTLCFPSLEKEDNQLSPPLRKKLF
jgi:hypothetical protein